MPETVIRPARRFANLRAAALGLIAVVAIAAPGVARAQMQRAEVEDLVRQYIDAHPEALGPAVGKYLADHPEALRDAIQALIAKRAGAQSTDAARQAIAANAEALYAAPLQTTLGDPKGSPTLVEFFDFNCGYCRKALADTLSLLADAPNLRIVLKQLPILGPDSLEAAKVAMALEMRHPSAAASLEFHRRLLSAPGRVNRAAALAVADQLGFDAAELEKDAVSAAVNEAVQQDLRLGAALGVHVTPAYVLGDSVISGAIGAAALKARITALKPP